MSTEESGDRIVIPHLELGAATRRAIKEEVSGVQERVGEISRKLDENTSATTRISTQLAEMNAALIGTDLAPGYIKRTDARVIDHETRLRLLEQYRWKLVGAIILAGALIGLIPKLLGVLLR